METSGEVMGAGLRWGGVERSFLDCSLSSRGKACMRALFCTSGGRTKKWMLICSVHCTFLAVTLHRLSLLAGSTMAFGIKISASACAAFSVQDGK